jgi:hypothetical protein
MAKNIKDKLWEYHESITIPELNQEKAESRYRQIERIKLSNPERNTQLVKGLVVACEKAWESNLSKKENAVDEITVDVSSLWKACVQKNDIYKLANNLQYRIHITMPNVYAKVFAACDKITVQLIDKASIQPSFIEEWLAKQTELTFHKLESFYKTQPDWVQRQHSFYKFIANTFEAVKQIVKHLFYFKIDRQEKKVILVYS